MQIPKKIVLFDIDHTIFDTNKYLEKLYNNLAKELGYEAAEFSLLGKNTYENIRKSVPYLSPDIFLENLLVHSKTSVDIKKLRSVFWKKEIYESSIYPDVKNIFDYLSKSNFLIGIFSTGDAKHQNIKIESLKKYLSENHIFISNDKIKIVKSTLLGFKDYSAFLIDDYPAILQEAQLHSDKIFTVLIKRENAFIRNPAPANFKPDATITNLSQLPDIIRTNK